MIRKRKKFALSLKVLSLLSCIAVLSVGFASWIIIQQPAQQNEAGTITTYTAASAGMELETEWVGGVNPVIVFGRPADFTPSATTWLSSKKQDGNYVVQPENLEAILKVTYTLTDANFDSITLALAATDVEDFATLLDTNETKGLLAVPTLQAFSDAACAEGNKLGEATAYTTSLVLNSTAVSGLEPEGNVYTFYVKVVFGWGEVFNSENPYVYYNAFKSNDVVGGAAGVGDRILNGYNTKTVAGQIAEAALTTLNTTMENGGDAISFNLTINGSVIAQ